MARMCLIAEHDPWDIQLLRLYAEQLGFGITQAFETQAVVSLTKQTHPDVLLLEVELPGAFGYQKVIRQIQSDPDVSQTTIILISRFGLSPVSCGDAAGLQTLLKPATCRGLQDCLEKAGAWRQQDVS